MIALVLASIASFSVSTQESVDSSKPMPPNVVLIVSDDAGYADFSFHGSDEMRTPHLDSIAEDGVRFSQGYVTASVCSPSRAGLLTGRYQQRFGHEHNFPRDAEDWVGLPTSERTLADALGALGYHTIALGKWHLGYGEPLHPNARGFDDFFGFLMGSRTYWTLEGQPRSHLQRNGELLEEDFDYMTDLLGEEAGRFIAAHAEEPFFLYLSFNAVHGPMHALEADLEVVSEELNEKRRKLVAMTAAMDRAVGLVLRTLEAEGLADRTLVVFVNDNGGAWNNASSNAPLRGTKGTPYEGGIRVPFLMRWPGVIPSGEAYDLPVSTLDVFATALAAAGGELKGADLDGVDLVPYLNGELEERPHEDLFWRRKENRAVRSEDWKLTVYHRGPPMLFDIASDPAEENDLAADRPEVVQRLQAKLAAWESGLIPPAWPSSATDPKTK